MAENYQVVQQGADTQKSLDDFQTKISLLIKEGWLPVGGIMKHSSAIGYVQALYKDPVRNHF